MTIETRYPLYATGNFETFKLTVTAPSTSSGAAIGYSTATETVRVANESPQWGIQARIDSGEWQTIDIGKSETFVVDMATQTVSLRKLLPAAADVQVDLQIYTSPTGAYVGSDGGDPGIGGGSVASTDITDSTAVGRAVLTAATTAAARTSLEITTAAADITDSTAVGRALLTTATTATARTSLGIGPTDPVTFTLTDYREVLYTHTTAGNITLALANGPVQKITLDAARTITAPADPGAFGASLALIINCGGFTPAWSGVTWLTADGTAPTLSTTAGKRNVISLIWDDNNGGTGAWLGMFSGREL